MPIIAIANQKGGVGKTATTFNLAHAISRAGRKVLMLDLDPQGSLTDYAGFIPAEQETTIYEVLHGRVPLVDVILEGEGEGTPALVPANIDLAAVELELAGAMEREYRLADVLEEADSMYDFILLDCPPSLGLLTINGLIASSGIIIPVSTQYSALRGLERLYDTVRLIQRRPNPALRILGILPTLFDARTIHSREALEIIEEGAGGMKVFSPIPHTVRMQESPVAKQAIFDYAPKSEAGKRFLKLAREVIDEC